MELFDLQVAKSGGEKPHHVLRFPDADMRGPGFLGEPGGQLKGREEPGGLGWSHPDELGQLGARSRSEPAQGAVAHLQQPPGDIKGRCPAGTSAEQDGQQFGRSESDGPEGPEAFPGAVAVGEGGE